MSLLDKIELVQAHTTVNPSARRPITLLFGFLPDVSYDDALTFARAQAEQQCVSLQNTRIYVEAVDDGYAYEVQEGGAGLALLPSVLAKLMPPSQVTTVYVPSSSRMIRVDRQRQGFVMLWMSEAEGDVAVATPDIVPSARMLPAQPDGKWALRYGVYVLLGGLVLMALMLISVGMIAPTASSQLDVKKLVPLTTLPISQLMLVDRAARMTPPSGDQAQVSVQIVYTKDKWDIRVVPSRAKVTTPAEPVTP